MSLVIRMHEGKWRIGIVSEEWEIPDRKEAEALIRELMSYKQSYGQINNKQ